MASGEASVTRRREPISIKVVNLCMWVDPNCGMVVRMVMVVSGLNQCMVKMFCKSASTVVLELRETVDS